MAIAYVQHQTDDAGGSGTGGFPIAYNSNNGAGNLLIFGIRLGGDPGATFTVTDSKSNTWTKIFQSSVNADDGSVLSMWYAKNSASGANSVTWTTANAVTMRYVLAEYSGIDTITALDKSTSNVSASFSATPTISSAQTPTNASSLVISFVSSGDVNTWTAGTGYSIRDTTAANGHLGMEDRILSSSSSQAPSFSASPGSPYNIGMAIFNGASGGSSDTALTVENASLTVTGQALILGSAQVVDNGSLSLTGQDVATILGQGIAVGDAALTLSGQDVQLLAGASFTLPVTEAALSVQGSTVDLLFTTVWTEGTLTLTGQDVTLTAGVSVTLGVTEAALTLAGSDVALLVDIDYILAVTEAALTLTGQDVALSALTSLVLAVDNGSLTLSGQDVGLFTPFATGGSSKGRSTRRRSAIKMIGR